MRNLNGHRNDDVLGLLTIPPRHLLEIETDGQARIVGAFSLDGKTGYSPQVVRTRDQLRVTVSELDRAIAAGMWIAIDHTDTVAPQSTPSGAPESDEPPAIVELPAGNDGELAALFDPVKVAQLEAMFPNRDAGNASRWPRHVERAGRNGLKDAAKEGRAVFNPYRAAVWWLATGPKDWKWERCLHVLANNLPARSIDSKRLLTGEYE